MPFPVTTASGVNIVKSIMTMHDNYSNSDHIRWTYQLHCCVKFTEPRVSKTLDTGDCSLEVTETYTIIICETRVGFDVFL